MRRCWFFHRWGNWTGYDSQPILVRRCMDCFEQQFLADTKRIDELNRNAKSFAEFYSELKVEQSKARGEGEG